MASGLRCQRAALAARCSRALRPPPAARGRMRCACGTRPAGAAAGGEGAPSRRRPRMRAAALPSTKENALAGASTSFPSRLDDGMSMDSVDASAGSEEARGAGRRARRAGGASRGGRAAAAASRGSAGRAGAIEGRRAAREGRPQWRSAAAMHTPTPSPMSRGSAAAVQPDPPDPAALGAVEVGGDATWSVSSAKARGGRGRRGRRLAPASMPGRPCGAGRGWRAGARRAVRCPTRPPSSLSL